MPMNSWIVQSPALLLIVISAAVLGVGIAVLTVGPVVGVVVPATVRAIIGALFN
jgi:hypothetical protein